MMLLCSLSPAKNVHPVDGINMPVELLLDAAELIDVILPRCLDHPRCYNLISNAAQKLQKEAHHLGQMKAQSPRAEHDTTSLYRTYILFLPCGPTAPSPEQDSKHLLDILHRLNRPGARAKASQVRKDLDSAAHTLAPKNAFQSFLPTARTPVVNTENVIKDLLKVLPRFHDRPHVYNLIVFKVQALQSESRSKMYGRSILGRLSFTKASPTAQDLELVKCKPEVRGTAKDRWTDVMLIDDIIETFSLIFDILTDIKAQCQNEAQSMQKKELTHLIHDVNRFR